MRLKMLVRVRSLAVLALLLVLAAAASAKEDKNSVSGTSFFGIRKNKLSPASKNTPLSKDRSSRSAAVLKPEREYLSDQIYRRPPKPPGSSVPLPKSAPSFPEMKAAQVESS